MSDAEQETPSKAASSGGSWSDQEKIAYLMVLCEHAADTDKFEAKINTCPVPAGRTTLSCRKLILRMKEKHREEMERIKKGQSLAATDSTTAAAKATPRKRKGRIAEGTDTSSEGITDGSPKKKKATPRARKKKDEVMAEVKNEFLEDEEMV